MGRQEKRPALVLDSIRREAFEEIKKIIARDLILAYPSYEDDEPFVIIYTDASSPLHRKAFSLFQQKADYDIGGYIMFSTHLYRTVYYLSQTYRAIV